MKKLLALLLALTLVSGILPAMAAATAEEPEAAALPKTGEVIQGFAVTEIRDFSMIGATLVLFEHQKTGARVLYIANGDTNRAFQLSFLTRPLDDTGLPHVFEHATLYGSEKYPSQTLLFNVMYQTYNTYVNAYTTDAMTSYPLASLSEDQLLRLADWYTDSCFHPNIMTEESIFKTQAWHYELADADSPLMLEGTVYSEMLGSMTLDQTALYNANQLTFPGASISYEYGGMPAHIPEMTWEQLKSYHDLYYHPSNCIAFLYGALDHYDAFLELLDREFSQYERREFAQAEEGYAPIAEPVEAAIPYPAAKGTDTVNQSHVIYYILCPGLKDLPEEEMILDHLCSLLSAEGSPLMQDLKKALPTGSFSLGREVAAPEDAIIFSAEHVGEADAGLFRETVQASLKTITEEGLSPDLVDALSAQLRLQNKLAGETSDPVMGIIYALAYNAAVTGNPFSYVEQMESYDHLAQENTEGKFSEAIRTWLLDPARYTLTTTFPAPGLKEAEDEALAASLAEIKAGMSPEEIEAIVAETNAQPAEEDNSALLASLKAVDVSSLPEEIKTYEIEDTVREDGVRRIDVTAGVEGVGEICLYFDARPLPQEDIHYMRLYTRLLGQMDTPAHSKEELSLLMDRYLCDRTIGVQVDRGSTPEEVHPWLVAQWTSLDEDLETGYALMMELLRDTDFSNTQVLSERISAQKASVRSQINSSPYLASLYRGLGKGDQASRYYAYLNYTDYYAFLEDLETKIAENPEEVTEGLRRVQSFLLNRQGAVAGFAGNAESIRLNRTPADEFLAQLPLEDRVSPTLTLPEPAASEGLIVDTNSGFNTLAAAFSQLEVVPDAGLEAAVSLVSDQILVPILRDQMGVYTPMSGILNEDVGIYLITFRDPNVAKTFDVYASLPELMEQLTLDQETLDGYILSLYSSLAAPKGELTGAISEINRLIAGKDADRVLNRMRQLKQVTPDSVRASAEVFRKLWERGYRATAAGAGAIRENADLYEAVLNPFGAVDAGEVTLQDVTEDRADYEAIRFAFENGLMAMKEEGVFAPDADATVEDLYAALYLLVGGASGAGEEALSALPAYGLAPELDGDTPLTYALRNQVMGTFGPAVGLDLPAIGEGQESEVMTRSALAQDLMIFKGED